MSLLFLKQKGNSLIVSSLEGVQHSKNTSHVHKYIAPDFQNQNETVEQSGQETVAPETVVPSEPNTASRSETESIMIKSPMPGVQAGHSPRPQRDKQTQFKDLRFLNSKILLLDSVKIIKGLKSESIIDELSSKLYQVLLQFETYLFVVY